MKKNTPLKKHLPVLTGGIMVFLVAILSALGVFDRQEINLRDVMTRLDARFHTPDPRIVLVAIDQQSMEFFDDPSFGVSWPWTRDLWANLVRVAESAGALVVMFDIPFETADIERLNSVAAFADQQFSESLSGSIPVVLAAQLRPKHVYPDSLPEKLPWKSAALNSYPMPDHGVLLPHRQFQHAWMGLSNAIPDAADGVFRSMPLLFHTQRDTFPGLALRTAGLINIIDPSTLRLDQRGRLWLRYYGAPGPGIEEGVKSTFPYIPAAQVITGQIDSEKLKGKILIVGGYAAGLLDYKSTPLSQVANPYPGFEIHATLLSNILNGDGLFNINPWISFLIILFFGLLTIFAIRFSKHYLHNILSLAAVVLLCLVQGFIAFHHGALAPVVSPILAGFAGFASTLYVDWRVEGKQRKQLQTLFSRYLDQSVIDELLLEPDQVQMGGVQREVSILFADMVGFTPASEKLTAPEVVTMLNDYYSAFVDVILAHRGLLDKYIGDAVMVLFGAPKADEQTKLLAAQAVLEVRRAMQEVTQKRATQGKVTIDICIGIHTDKVVVGNIGHPRRLDYTAIGNGVNTASRLEGATRTFKTHNLASAEFCQDLPETIARREIGRVILKGLSHPITAFELVAEPVNKPWLRDWAHAWDLWRQNQRQPAIDKWKSIAHIRADDKVLEFLIKRLEKYVDCEGGEDDVVTLESKK